MPLSRLRKSREPGTQPAFDVRGFNLPAVKELDGESFNPQEAMSTALWKRILNKLSQKPENLLELFWSDDLVCICRLAILFPERRADFKINEKHWEIIELYLKQMAEETYWEKKGAATQESELITFGLLFFPDKMQNYRDRLAVVIPKQCVFKKDYNDKLIREWLGSKEDQEISARLKEEYLDKVQHAVETMDSSGEEAKMFEIMLYLIPLKMFWGEIPDKDLEQKVIYFCKQILARTRDSEYGGIHGIAEMFFNLMVLTSERMELSQGNIKFIPHKMIKLEEKVQSQPEQLAI